MYAARSGFVIWYETTVILGVFLFSSIRTSELDKIIVCSSMLFALSHKKPRNAYVNLGLVAEPFHSWLVLE